MLPNFPDNETLIVHLEWNKKVLLRERKRHTVRRVASTRCAAPVPWVGEGVPTLAGGTYLEWGVPTLERGGYLLWKVGTYPGWKGYLPYMGGFLSWMRGVLTHGKLEGRLSPGVNRGTPVKTVPSPMFRMRAVIITNGTYTNSISWLFAGTVITTDCHLVYLTN